MIKIVEGNILDAPEKIICHQVNCQGVMGAGLAKQICNKWKILPNYKNYIKSNGKEKVLGTIQLIAISFDTGQYICNIFGQYDYGRDKSKIYTDYSALKNALTELGSFARLNKFSIAIPFNIGCGLAGGKWDIVYSVIEDVFQDYDVTLYKFK